MALRRVWMASPNYSSRGSGVRLIVVHTAEGALTYQSLGNFFASSSSGVSSHTGIDDTPGTVGEYVRREHKAWTQANANPYSVATELCAFASWDAATWRAHPVMLENCAQWIAEEAAAYSIPIRKLSAAEAQGGAAGVCGHVDLGASGGGHWDPGPAFPWSDVISMALGGAGISTPPAPAPSAPLQEEDAMAVSLEWNGGRHVFSVGPDGRLRQHWERNQADGSGKEWAGATIGDEELEPNQAPGHDEHSGQLHLYAVTEHSKVFHAWQAKGAGSWGTEVLS